MLNFLLMLWTVHCLVVPHITKLMGCSYATEQSGSIDMGEKKQDIE